MNKTLLYFFLSPRFIWFETALVFGPLVPLLLPLLALQLFLDAHILEWMLMRAPSTCSAVDRLLVQRQTMQCHVAVVLMLQSALSMFFFVDSELQGWLGVVVVLPLICLGMLLALVWGLQLRDLWLLLRDLLLLVYRKCSPTGDMEEAPHRVTELFSPMHDEGGSVESRDDGAFPGE